MKKKKILFIIWSFTYGGGAEKILANIVNNLDSKKYDIDVIEYFNANIKKEEVNKNINILEPFLKSDSSIFKRKIYFLLLLICPFLIRRKYIKDTYDIEIAFNYMIPTFLLSRKKGVKKIAWIHGDIYDLKDTMRNRFFQRRSLKKVDSIVAISKNTYNSIVEVYPEFKNKTNIIYNGYIFNDYVNKSKEFNPNLPENNILFINRFDSNKNPIFAVDVAKKLDDLGIDFNMAFIGKGDLEKTISRKIKEYKLSKKVQILGYKDNPYPYILNSKIIIGCSYSEGFPTIFIEALALGKTFVTTSVGGVNEISNNQKCGIIAESIDDFVTSIVELLFNTKKYDSLCKNGLIHVKKYSIENQINEIEKLFINKV